MAIAPTNPSATNVLVTSMGSLLFLFLCPQVNEGRSALVPMEQEAVFFCLFCACSDGTSKEAVFFCLFSVSIFRSPCSAPPTPAESSRKIAPVFLSPLKPPKALGQGAEEGGVSY